MVLYFALCMTGVKKELCLSAVLLLLFLLVAFASNLSTVHFVYWHAGIAESGVAWQQTGCGLL